MPCLNVGFLSHGNLGGQCSLFNPQGFPRLHSHGSASPVFTPDLSSPSLTTPAPASFAPLSPLSAFLPPSNIALIICFALFYMSLHLFEHTNTIPFPPGAGTSPTISRNTGGFSLPPFRTCPERQDLHVFNTTSVIFQNAESQSGAPPGHWHSVCQAIRRLWHSQTAQVLNGFTSFMLRTLELTMGLDK